MDLLEKLNDSIFHNGERIAFVINKKEYSYNDLAVSISGIREAIKKNIGIDEKQIGLIANDDLETYATIFALWFEGLTYVPLDLDTPKDRIINIIEQTFIKTIFDSSSTATYYGYKTILSKSLKNNSVLKKPKIVSKNTNAYILFTSGTTGVPKGVPITFSNLVAFCDAFFDFGIELSHNDRCLQMFGLTFDVSVMSYLLPILKGARVYTIPKNEIKFQYIYELIQDENLTYALMVPSILHYLRPYLDELNSPYFKYGLFCGEGLPLDVTEELSKSLPNTQIMNVYGPTECTMLCTGYVYKKDSKKAHNGIVSIGKPWKNVQTIIINEKNEILPFGKKGELCLSGKLLTTGYWYNPVKNEESFFTINYNGVKTKFYKTGDLCYIDSDGDIMFLGRIDFQAKVQGGYRVELSEIEHYAKEGLNKINVAAIAYTNRIGGTEIGLAIEINDYDTNKILDYLKLKMPPYMIPSQIKYLDPFPLNVNGKIDRNKLKELFK